MQTDKLGTFNSLALVLTVKLQKSSIETEDEGRINWAPNGASLYYVINWATHHVHKQKDNEAPSAHAFDVLDVPEPMVDFNRFFNRQALVQKDLAR